MRQDMVIDDSATKRRGEQLRSVLTGIAPWVVGIILFWVVGYHFYAPQFEGMSLSQGDIVQYGGMSRDIHAERDASGDDPAWTGAMFSGMPAYLIDVEYPTQWVKQGTGAITGSVAQPMGMTFWAMVMMMVAVVLFGINPWIGIVAALAYGLSTYNFLIIDAGHITKMWAMVYAPPLVAAVWHTLRRNMWLGAALAALFGSLELGANHPQITYYFLIACLMLWLGELWHAYRGSKLPEYMKRSGLLLIAALIALASNIAPLWFTAEHQRHTTRGVSEVVSEERARTERIAYNTAWSYGIAESFNMVVPNYMGAGSMALSNEVAEVLRSPDVQQALIEVAIDDLTEILATEYGDVRRSDVVYYLEAGDEMLLDYLDMLYQARVQEVSAYAVNYWGRQPFTAGPTYVGAVAFMLALMALCVVPRRRVSWVVASCVVAIVMAWGANVMGVYELLYDLLPGYKSFRTVSMALVVVQCAVPLLAAYALWRMVCRSYAPQRMVRAALVAWGAVVLITVVMYWVNDLGVEDIYATLGEAVWVDKLRSAAVESRGAMLLADTLRTLLLVTLAMATVVGYAYAMGRWRTRGRELRIALVVVLGALLLCDLVGVADRYMTEDKWLDSAPTEVVPLPADEQILRDGELGYRVLDMSVDPFNSARASYFHRSVGGYHGAKLGRYQDVVDRYLKSVNGGVLAALNTRYIIESSTTAVAAEQYTGISPYGAAWFVGDVVRCATPGEELEAIGVQPLDSVAVVGEGVELAESYSTQGSITLTEYAPHRLRYDYSAADSVLCVFSEIYFPEGWSVTIDGVAADYFAVDYILRGMVLPAGEHVVEWRFEPPHRDLLNIVMAIASALIVVGCGIALVMRYRGRYDHKC